jgi:hypothetical protein
VDKVLSSIPNDSIGSPLGFISPWFYDAVAVAIISLLLVGDIDHGLTAGLGYLLAGGFAACAAYRARVIQRYITDTPRSKVASAAQGFVEVQGSCEFYGDREIQGFMSGPPCVWHRYLIVRFGRRDSGMPLQVGASDIPFVVRDSTGACVVNPRGAKILSSSKRSWTSDGKFFSSTYIRHGARMYVIGELRAHNCSVSASNENAQVSGLLASWKQDKLWLLSEFDSDNNGELDPDEWAAAVKRARTVARDLADHKAMEPVQHTISKPKNGLPMLISDRHPDQLARQFALFSSVNIGVTVLCTITAASVLL